MKSVLAQKSFFISIACHVLAFSLLSFSLTPRATHASPAFYFLGSILTAEDVLSPIFTAMPIQEQAPLPLVSRRVSRSKVNPNRVIAVAKPGADRRSPDQKEYQKTFFETAVPGREEGAVSAEPVSPPLGTPRLKPIGIYRTGEK